MARKTKTPPSARGLVIHVPTFIDVDLLNPAPYNPRKIKPAKLAALKQKIREVGFLDPIVVQRHSDKFEMDNVIVGGHQRLRAVREVCAEENIPVPKLPIIMLDIDDRTAMKLNVALNNINGEWDTELLAKLLSEMDSEEKMNEAEIGGMGFSTDDFEKYISLDDEPDIETETPVFGKSVTCSLAFGDVATRDHVKKRIEEIAKLENKRTGEVVAAMFARNQVKRRKVA